MKIRRNLKQLALGNAALILSAQAWCAPHLEPCIRISDYEVRVERLMRNAWPERLDLLVIMYGLRPERGLGLARGETGYDFVRSQFDNSFWYSSWIDVEQGGDKIDFSNAAAISTTIWPKDETEPEIRILDFSNTEVGVSTVSIPVSDEFAIALIDAFESGADSAREEDRGGERTTDGYTYEILFHNRPCVELRNPPPQSEAGRMADLVRFLDGSRSWDETVEAEALRLLREINSLQ